MSASASSSVQQDTSRAASKDVVRLGCAIVRQVQRPSGAWEATAPDIPAGSAVLPLCSVAEEQKDAGRGSLVDRWCLSVNSSINCIQKCQTQCWER